MNINLQINKMMIKMNKQRYFDVSFWYSRASWGVLGCLGVIKLTHIGTFSWVEPVLSNEDEVSSSRTKHCAPATL